MVSNLDMLALDPASEDATPCSGPPSGDRPRIADGGVVLAEAQGDAPRRVLERFVARRFREVYGAHVTHFLPRLFGARDPQGNLVAAFGLRSASQGALYLERYLDVRIEVAIGDRFGRAVERSAIAEVGNLAGATAGALRALIPTLTQALADAGFAYVAFTGSARLCNGFARLGLPLCSVAPAMIQRLPASERPAWGRYYDSAPAVMVGDIVGGARLMEAFARHPQVLRAQLAPLASVGAP